MKKNFLLDVFLYILLTANLFSAFETYNWGTRAIGMGGAFVSVCDDASCVVWNPAGTALLDKPEFLFTYSKPYLGIASINLNKNFLSFVLPTNIVPVGLSLTTIDAGKDIKYNENVFIVASSLVIKKVKFVDISIGWGIKFLWNKFSTNVEDPVINNKNGRLGVAFDVGTLCSTELFNKKFSFSFSTTINEPDIGIKHQDLVKRKFIIGIALTNKSNRFGYILSANLLLYNEKALFPLGGEFSIRDDIFLRLGYNYSDLNFGIGYFIKLKFLDGIKVDYAYSLPLTIKESSGSHNISFIIRFGKKVNFKKG